jgi:UDPglucose--hexose-1-phosphate uridylyltransferase
MSGTELRHDALSDRMVVVATGRAARPHQFRAPAPPADDVTDCPFCPGHEAMTPPEIARIGPLGDAPDWQVRVFPNLYPIVDVHEVVVLSPSHEASFAQLTDDAATAALLVLRDRVRAHLDAGHPSSVAIVNHKLEAGASLPHPHAQVLATDFVPPAIAAAVARAAATPDDLLRGDGQHGHHVVELDGARSWCPHASCTPYHLRISHDRSRARFDLAPDDEVATVATVLRDTLASLLRVADDPPYNVIVHSAPAGVEQFRWYVEIVPRLAVVAGFELATGLFVDTVDPAIAARALRSSIEEAPRA